MKDDRFGLFQKLGGGGGGVVTAVGCGDSGWQWRACGGGEGN